VDLEHAGTLAVDVVQERRSRIEQMRPRTVLQPLLHLFGARVWSGFEEQRNSTGDVRRRHRRAAQVPVPALFEWQPRPNPSPGSADVRLEAEIGRKAER